ncbi:MAG TPA: glutathione S-transferase family protein [Kofleriaceae bacterium]|jgi:glutathione S-transferase|nr:glutathione S-transferase family protein [Kofleriaceae bacterium]
MTDLILHHFDASPFSEKVRLVLGLKRLAWRSVKVPIRLPKPDAVALTGGYRRTPFLQIGADIYCDTALMCRVIDRLAPEPPLYPAAAGGAQHVLAQWADTALFWAAVPYTLQPAGFAYAFGNVPPEEVQALAADRAAMTAGMRRATLTDATAQLTGYLGWLESMLPPGQPFLFGHPPCIADVAVAHPLWFIRLAPPVAGVLAPFERLAAWYERVIAFGHGTPAPLASEDAIAIAARAGAHAPAAVEPGLGFEAGAQVTVAAADYGTDPVAGTLVGLSTGEVVIERRDERAGTVHVHFPRIGYQIKKAS